MSESLARASAWDTLHASRMRVGGLDGQSIPARPGVFALYRDDRAVWIGRSVNLRGTLASALAKHGLAAVSPLRRSVAAFLGLCTPQAIAAGRYRPTPEDHESISRWIRECEVGWRECACEDDVSRLESLLRAEPERARTAPPRLNGAA